ncbi:MAG: hypothetical protein ACMXYF_00075 [Candidatus Woesearchaeota archaeon]
MEKLTQEQLREHIEEGYIHFSTIVEIMGKPKEHIEQTAQKIVEKLNEDSRFMVLQAGVSEAELVEDSKTMYSLFIDFEMLAQDMSRLYDFIFAYMPSSVEILEPQTLTFNTSQATGILNDINSRIHDMDMEVKKLRQVQKHMSQSIEVLISNAITLSLRIGNATLEQISGETGVEKEQLKPFLERLEKAKKIKREEDTYMLQ